MYEKEIGQSQQIHRESVKIKEMILSNPAFIRFAGGFELYQELLKAESNIKNRDIISQRMF